MINKIFKMGWPIVLVLFIVAGLAVGDNSPVTPPVIPSGSIAGTSAQASTACCDLAGDANSDATVNVGDAVAIINYVFKGGDAPQCSAEGDANADGTINVGDAVHIINYIFKGGPAPVCYLIQSTTIVISPDDTTVIRDYDIAGTVTLDKTSAYADSVSVGDIIIGQDDAVAPDGFLRKVTNKIIDGGSIVLETEPATMMDAFETMDISETHTLRPSGLRSVQLRPGATLVPNRDDETFTVALDHVFYDQDGDPETTDDQIRLDGQYAFTAALFAEIEMSWFTLRKFETGIETNQNVNIDLTANLQWEFDDEVEFDLAEFHFGAIPLGGVVWLVPTLTVEAHIHGDLTVTFETGITYTQQLRFGFGYVDGGFYDISESTKDFTYTKPELTATFNFETGASLNASCLVYGVAGPYMAGKAGFHFQSVLNADPCDVKLTFDLEAILYAVVGVECDILGLDYSKDFRLYTHQIGEWVYPLGGTGTIVIDPEPNSLNAPWSLVGPCSYSTSGTGDQTLTNLDPGEYTITWEAVSGWTAPSNSMQTLEAGQTVTFNGAYTEGEHETGTVTDFDGTTYETVRIGDQWWMAENLKVTHYRNGYAIPNVTDGYTWNSLTTGAYCNYNNNEAYFSTYGRLYNWYAVSDSRNLAPEGWHVPSDAEWQTLIEYLGGETVAGGKMKEAGTAHWADPNSGATNESGFTALAAGCRYYSEYFNNMDSIAVFQSSTGVNSFYDIHYYSAGVFHHTVGETRNGFSIRCVKDVEMVPVLTTADVTEITETTAQCGGTITSDGGATVTARGVCWSTNPTPTIVDDTTNDGAGTGSFISSITGLTAGTLYYVRAYATNSAGTGYGNIQPFTTATTPSTVTDIDGNIYHTVTIGTQVWMVEYLKVTRYRNGDAITNVTDNGTWAGLSTGGYCNYNNDPGNGATYGRLYNWYAVSDSRIIAPTGWHVPTDVELEQLEMYLGMSQAVADQTGWRGTDEGGKLKEAGITHWFSPNTGATNESGFSALPGGFRDYGGKYNNLGSGTHLWSSSIDAVYARSWYRAMGYNSSAIFRNSGIRTSGMSIRCVKD